MPFWVTALIWVASAVVVYAFLPRPQAQNKPPDATAEEFDGPDTEEGKSIPVVFGTRDVFPSVLWYGDVWTEEIMSDSEDSMSGGKK